MQPTVGHSQHYRFEHLGTQEGLPNSTITAIIQEDRGFMWIGTRDGLGRYDGYQFVTYRNNPLDSNSLSHNFVSAVVQDNDEHLWVGTRNGLNKYDLKSGKFTRYMHNDSNPNSISSNSITTLALDSDGNLWIGTQMTGVDKFNIKQNSFEHYTHTDTEKSSISNNIIRYIYKDSKNRLWIATNHGLNRYDSRNNTFSKYTIREPGTGSVVGENVKFIFEDSRQQLWLGTFSEGLFLFDPADSSFVQYKQDKTPGSLSTNTVLSLNEDERGNLWVGTENGGLCILDRNTGKFHAYAHDEIDRYSINGNSISPIVRDKQGNMWLGTFSAGLNLFKRNTGSFAHYRRNTTAASISSNYIWDILEDKDKNIWVATDGGGVDKIDASTGIVTNYKQNPGPPDLKIQRNKAGNAGPSGNYVLGMEEDDEGNIWMATWGNSISVFDPKKNEFSHLNHDPNNPNTVGGIFLYDILQTKDKMIWIASTDGGLNRYDRRTDTFTRFKRDVNNPQAISSNSILSLLEDSKGNLWIGSYDNGLNLMDRKTNTFTRYVYSEGSHGLSNNSVSDIFEDHAGNLWVSTFDGLNKLNPERKSFTLYTTADGLPGNIIYAVREDDNHNLWISTNHGLSMFDPATEKFKNYTTEDGLQDDEFKPHSALKTSDGKLFFGGINGFNVFSPSDIVKPLGFSPVMITSFRIFNKAIAGTDSTGDISRAELDISHANLLCLSHKQTFFSIEYAALDFSSADKKNYAFMLEGFDHDWNYVGTRNTASYTNVPAGTYTFKVKYQNSRGDWSPANDNLKITVNPPFWLTWWFISLLVVTVIGCIFAYIRIRINSIRQQKINLELQVSKKTAQVVAQNQALEQQQTEINHKNESLQALVVEKDDLLVEKEWLLKEIHHRVKNNFHIVSSLLEIQSSYLKNEDALAAIQECQHRIYSMSIIHQKLYQSETLSTIHMPEYIYELVEYLRESYLIREDVGFSLEIDNIELNHASAINLGLILNEAITNAIKHAFVKRDNCKISISLTQISDSQVLLAVQDNGPGLSNEAKNKLGNSMGMELLRGLTEDIGGRLTIESDNGTCIKIIFDHKETISDKISFT